MKERQRDDASEFELLNKANMQKTKEKQTIVQRNIIFQNKKSIELVFLEQFWRGIEINYAANEWVKVEKMILIGA